MIAYFNGRFIEREQVTISPDDRGFVLADGVYEVIRAYGGKLFQLAAHLERLEYGLAQLRIAGADVAEIGRAASRLLVDNHLLAGDATVYIQVTRGVAPRTHSFPPAGTPPTVYAIPKRFEPQPEMQKAGVAAILVPDVRWSRCDIKSTALVANVLANQRASEAGVFEAFFVRDGVILEGSRTNVFAVKSGTLLTAPLSNYILGGITRKLVLGLAASLSIPIAERPIFEAELADLEEVMVVGTTVEVTPVVKLNGQAIRSGLPGPVTSKLQTALRGITRSLEH